MPDRYWVGGTASWDGTAGTKWSATSGGPGGASVPTTADDVFFNAASGAGTVTIADGNTGARSINYTGFTGTVVHQTTSLTVAGSITLNATMTYTLPGERSTTITGTGTLTTAGKTFTGINVNGVGITVTLGSALTTSAGTGVGVTAGTFTTANFNVTTNAFASNNSNVRTINLGSSTISILTSILAFNISTTTNLTFNAGTSQINLVNPAAQLLIGGQTFHNVTFTDGGFGSSTATITGDGTFNNLSFTGPGSTGVFQVALSGRQTINGTLSTNSTAGNRRVWFRSTTYGISTRLVVNSAPSLTDADFRDVIVSGTAAPISGTRIGDLRGNSGITFSAPKTVFRIGTGNWSANQWSGTSGGAVSTDEFPLAQDIAVFNNSTSAGTHTMDSAIPYCGTVDMSARTTALTLTVTTTFTVYGNWTNGSGITQSGSFTLSFSGRNTQTIISVGRPFVATISIDTFGGTVELGDAISTSSSISLVNGEFNSKGYTVTGTGGANISSISTLPRTLTIVSSTVSIQFNMTVGSGQNFTFNSANSTVLVTPTNPTFLTPGLQFNNVSFTSTSVSTTPITGGTNTFNNLTIAGPTSTGQRIVEFESNQIVTGTLTVSGTSPIRRVFVRSNTLGTQRTITAGSIAATDCDFRDITIAGTAAGSSPTRAGNAGNNSGITFPAPKTVYWMNTITAGNRNWSAPDWAASSGGTPDANNFPLAQDTAIFDDASATTTLNMDQPWFVGSIDGSARTSSIAFSFGTFRPLVTGNLSLAPGSITTFSADMVGIGVTQTLTTNGKSMTLLLVDAPGSTIVLADALSVTGIAGLTLTRGTFDAVTYNVTTTIFSTSNSNTRTLKMGSGTWTITGTGTAWDLTTTTNLSFDKGTANIVLSDNTTASRTFAGGGLAYNKLTIGGNTSISSTSITGSNTFTELASTKTVAHTINFGNFNQTFGAWTVTGTAGNVVTLSGTAVANVLAGAATSGIDYLAMGNFGFATASPGEFYAGPNSTGTAPAPVFRTAPPAARTLYWVGGTGNWGDTARWSTSSGGGGGAAVPTSLDNVIFNSASNATAYTATLNVVARCNQLTIAGPASGNLTLASSATTNSLIIHGNTVFPATGFTRTFSSAMVLSGSTTGKTFTSNGVAFQGLGSGAMIVNGVGAGWSMSDPLNLGNNDFLNLVNGTFSTNNHGLTVATLRADTGGSKTLNLGSSTVTMTGSSSPIQFGSTETIRNLFTFNAGSSQINISTTGASVTITGNSLAFNHMSITATVSAATFTLNGTSTYNNLTFGAPPVTGLQNIVVNGNTVVTGTLTFTAGTNATRRHFCRTSTIGTTRTITCAAFSGTDVDFRDIAITGAAAPVSGTRLGDCKGNSGITFPTGVSKFWNLITSGSNWSATAWATSSGGTPAANNFPLAQDTCVFQPAGLSSGTSMTIDAAFNIGTVDMSALGSTTALILEGTSVAPAVYGNWINGLDTPVQIFSGGSITFSGRTTQTITSAGLVFDTPIIIDSPGGSVTLLDALSMFPITSTLTLTRGTLNCNNFTVTCRSFVTAVAATRSLNLGTGALTITGGVATPFSVTNPAGFTVTGSGTINMNAGGTFAGGDIDYSGITLNHNSSSAITITGNNTFRDITATRTATGTATINLGTTTQRVTRFTGKGEATRLLTIQGTSVTSPATLIYTGTGPATNTSVDFLSLLGVRAYSLTNTWYAGNNSINNGTLGWIFEPTPAVLPGNGNFFLMFL